MSEPLDLVVRNARVATASDVFDADIGIRGGRIVSVGGRAGDARTIVDATRELGIRCVTLYAFSVENWNRPKDEVDTLMKYLQRFLKNEIGELNKNNVRLEAIGQIWRLPEAVQQLENGRPSDGRWLLDVQHLLCH